MPKQPEGLRLREINETRVAGGRREGCHPGSPLALLEGVHVPDGFCLSTTGFERVILDAPALAAPLESLTGLGSEQHEAIPASSAAHRRLIEAIAIPRLGQVWCLESAKVRCDGVHPSPVHLLPLSWTSGGLSLSTRSDRV